MTTGPGTGRPTDESSEAAEPPVKAWEVELSGTVYTTVEVEAASEEEARDEALSVVKGYWHWDDDVSFPEVEGVREVAP